MRTPLLLALLLIGLTARPQQHRPNAASQTAADRKRLLTVTAGALPRLYEKKDFDSIAYYIQLRWQPGGITPDLFCEAALLSIQRHIFYLVDFHDFNSLTWPMIDELTVYSNVLAQLRRMKRPSEHARRGYFNSSVRQLYFTTAHWASDLLNTGGLDSVETFLCQVFSGAIRYPQDYLMLHAAPPTPDTCALPARPSAPHKLGGVLSISAGSWIPTGHLSLLGVHPSFNYEFGARNRWNEWDLDAALRFVNTPRPYALLRSDTLMSRTYFDGGNLSFNYTRYLVHHTRWEAGLSTGVGFDFLDFTSNSASVDWSPTEITCFDFNVGFRYNLYFSRHGFVGLVARYHFLNYSNPGGSPFDGNAASVDIILGRVGEYKR